MPVGESLPPIGLPPDRPPSYNQRGVPGRPPRSPETFMSNPPPLDVLEQAAEWKTQGLGVALATVVRTWGSAPRQAGSQMCINGDGHFVGSVSGGCVEGAVIQEAQELMVQGGTKLLKFGVTDEQAWEVGLTCGGEVEIYVERVE